MDFVRNAWYVVMWSQDLKAGELVGRTLLNDPVVIFRDPDGRVNAMEDICPHRLAPLSMGKLVNDGKHIRCAYHGLEFDGAGKCAHNPHASGRIPKNSDVRAYSVVEKHSLIWIWMGERAADPAIIPYFPLLDGAHQVSKRDWMKMEANYQLIVDNLLDVSHTAFLHEGLLGGPDTVKGNMKVVPKETKNALLIERWIDNIPVPKFFDLLFKRDGQRVDNWMNMTWQMPACLTNDTGVTSPGKPRCEGTGIFGMHFITPETDRSSWYHFAAVRQNPISLGEPGDSETMKQIAELRRYAFEVQDKGIIEGQQRILDIPRFKDEPFVPLETDLGTVSIRRHLQDLIDAEKKEKTAVAA